ncbi:MAG: hypothetical protein WD135_08200, partial [Ferruginibacter sp.]
MNMPTNRLGLTFAAVYAAICIWGIASQGLFGESFIVLIVGLPWSLLFAFFEYGGATVPLLYVYVFIPLILNVAILYWLGVRIQNSKNTKNSVLVIAGILLLLVIGFFALNNYIYIANQAETPPSVDVVVPITI